MQTNTKKVASTAAALGCVLGLMNGAPSVTQAYFTRMGAGACRVMFPQNAHTYEISDGEAYLANSLAGAYRAKFACPVPDTTGQPKSSITSIQVYVTDNDSLAGTDHQVSARACAFNAIDGTGGSCGTTVDTSGSGKKVLTPPLTELSTASETAYILIFLPPRVTEIGSRIEHLYFGS